MAARIPAGPVLCLAEGEGRNAVHLASLGHAVTAVDQSAAGLAKAQRLAAARGVEIRTVVADLAMYPIVPGAWAGIVATFAHLPPALRRAVHAAVVQGLAPGGVFILEAYTPAQLAFDTGGPKAPELLMPLAALREELAGLEFLVAREIEREVVEGCGHTGRGAVVQVLARRH
jgi:SAM-dependent methyltransferase